jgi:hypothetical protein
LHYQKQDGERDCSPGWRVNTDVRGIHHFVFGTPLKMHFDDQHALAAEVKLRS